MATESKPLPSDIQAKMEKYRKELIAFEMCEPIKRNSSSCHWYFYKPMTALTAFIVNVQGNEFYIEVAYGYASTAFTRIAGDENALIELGVSDEDITIREKVIICDETDEATTAKMKDFRIVIWGMHGLYGAGKTMDETFGLIETVEKAAQIYMLTAHLPRINTIRDEEMKELADYFKVNYRKDFLNL